jgi:hypothetical protein
MVTREKDKFSCTPAGRTNGAVHVLVGYTRFGEEAC